MFSHFVLCLFTLVGRRDVVTKDEVRLLYLILTSSISWPDRHLTGT